MPCLCAPDSVDNRLVAGSSLPGPDTVPANRTSAGSDRQIIPVDFTPTDLNVFDFPIYHPLQLRFRGAAGAALSCRSIDLAAEDPSRWLPWSRPCHIQTDPLPGSLLAGMSETIAMAAQKIAAGAVDLGGGQNHPLGLGECRRHGRHPPVLRRDPRAVTTAAPLRHRADGAGSRTSNYPRTTTLPLGSQQNASPFCDHLRCRCLCAPDSDPAGWG